MDLKTDFYLNCITESRDITTQPGEIEDRKSEVIAFVINAGMNITADNFNIFKNQEKKSLCLKYLLCSTEVLLDISQEYVSQIQGYQW